ncbi:hypothetical protein [Aquipseudomonas alcaligenes]|uniref:Uncharacterized protein n=1 Tax=Aquipseudomonas alcaligenes TaxID=43263 RepID=A0AB73I323_AQUAC|nr:hypothetical protein [Pseudomonas alcaligenes]MDH0144609.1 hypothetical protein [Pseudomonas alcaligenes]
MSLSTEEILSAFGNGHITKEILISELIDLCIYNEPKEILARLPVDIVKDIKEKVKKPPSTCLKLIHLEGKNPRSHKSEKTVQLEEELQRIKGFAGIWRMHAHFYLSTQNEPRA